MSDTARIALNRPLTLALPVVLVSILIDQLTKMWVLSASKGIEGTVLAQFEPIGRFTFIYNTGVSFSFASGVPQLVLGVGSLLVVAFLFWWLASERGLFAVLGIGFLAGGAIGNAIDRFWLPGVVDFIDLDFFPFDYFIFNLADCGISLGVGLILFDWVFNRRSKTA